LFGNVCGSDSPPPFCSPSASPGFYSPVSLSVLSSASSGSNGSGVVFGGTVLPSGVSAGCSWAVVGCGSVGVSFPSGRPSVTPRLDKEIDSFSGFCGTGFSSGFGVTGC